MKKFILLLSATFIFVACTTKQVDNKEINTIENNMDSETPKLQKQEVEINGSPALLGQITEDDLLQGNYEHWYQFFHSEYNVNQTLVNEFKDDLESLEIRVFIGTWCPDSQERTPAFFKILEAANYPKDQVKMYSLNAFKEGLNQEETEFNIAYVPTFAFYKDGNEIGRIVESPIQTLEEDIRDIVQGNPQTPKYAK